MLDTSWSRSSHCTYSNCVEAARQPGGVAVRDSADPDSPHLRFTPAAWAAFTARTARETLTETT